MEPFVHGVVRVEPLAVLLVPVEDERLADEALADQLEHVLDRRGIAERQPHFGLEAFGVRQALGSPDVPIVVADWFFHQAVLASLQHVEDHLLVVGAGHDIDHVDIGAGEHLLVVRDELGNAEFLGAGLAKLPVEITQHHHVAQRRTGEARQVRRRRPAARPNHADAQSVFHLWHSFLLARHAGFQRVPQAVTQ